MNSPSVLLVDEQSFSVIGWTDLALVASSLLQVCQLRSHMIITLQYFLFLISRHQSSKQNLALVNFSIVFCTESAIG